MTKYNEDEIAKAQSAWRKQDLKTWGQTDPESVSTRHNALLDLLCAHTPTQKEPKT